ncbi:MAG: type II toxin-antitoxin system prevent-host-death family antitoxin [Deltaproteobacteria bacterium]|nr:type II toxin-antitoxin system prevent-host-death family antitoxin [Deltaproteobacteria bacterium]
MTSAPRRAPETGRRVWPVQDAKARFSELLAASLEQGPQILSKRGVEAAVLVRIEEWRRLCAAARPSFKELLQADEPRAEIPVPRRGARRRRSPAALAG